MILGVTGYRSNKLGGYKLPNPHYNYVCQEFEKLLLELKPDKCISGFAQGFDQYCANICLKLKIPLIAAIPFIGQEAMWPNSSKKIYYSLLDRATEKVIVSEGGYSASKLQIRNQWIVDNCDILVACIRSDETSGGSYNCREYAKSKNKDIRYIDPGNIKV